MNNSKRSVWFAASISLSLAAGCSSAPSGMDAGDEKDAGVVTLPSATATQVAVGRLHLCALTSAGAVRCWGTSEYGEVGTGAPFNSDTYLAPLQVKGLTSGVTALSSRNTDHTCAVLSTGVKCWGRDTHGQLGTGMPPSSTGSTNSAVPVAVTGLGGGVKGLSMGEDYSCAITAAGSVKCWGSNEYGKLGNNAPFGTNSDSSTPVDVVGLDAGVASISSGWMHTCVVTDQGAAKCWGSNTYGELGQDPANLPSSHVAVDVPGLGSGIASISTGHFATCAITTAGAAKCWGSNDKGQLGNGTHGGATDVFTPTAVTGISSGATSISIGNSSTCAVVSGSVKCWGSNDSSLLGLGANAPTEVYVPGLVTGLGSGWASVGIAASHACALSTAGAIKCWGEAEGGGGPLGNGTNSSSNVPVGVLSLP